MGATGGKSERRATSDPLGIDPLATIAFLAAREQLSERLADVSTVQAPSVARRRRAWRTVLAQWIHELAELLGKREPHGRRAAETRSSQPTA